MKIDPIRAGVALSVVGILYLTLYPFKFSAVPNHGLYFAFPYERGEWLDTLLNLLLFLPFGFFGGLLSHSWRGVLWTGVAGMVLSICIERTQIYIPTRDASYRDVILNSAGALAGALLAHLQIVQRTRLVGGERTWTPSLGALFLTGIWVFAEWFPFMPSFRLFKIPRVLLDKGPWVPVLALGFAAFAVARMLPLLSGSRALPFVRAAFLAMIPMQFFLNGRTVRAIEVAAQMVGMAAGLWLRPGRLSLALGGLAALALRQFTPFDWEATVVNPFGWTPFAAAFNLVPEQSFRILMEKFFFATYAIWALRRAIQTPLWTAVLAVTALVALGEIGQTYQPGRVPEITDLLICGLGGLVLGSAGDKDVATKDD